MPEKMRWKGSPPTEVRCFRPQMGKSRIMACPAGRVIRASPRALAAFDNDPQHEQDFGSIDYDDKRGGNSWSGLARSSPRS
jgi:hypothetical protein